jgi:uncharacterized membrane protein
MKFLEHRKISSGTPETQHLLLSLLRHLDAKTRLGVSIMLAMSSFLLLPSRLQLDFRILVSWIAGVGVFLSLVVLMMNHATPQKTCYRVQRQEAHHLAIFLLVVITACTSIFAIALIQANNKDLPPTALTLEVCLALLAVICSWFLTHTMFALHYATCYYSQGWLHPENGEAEIGFPGESAPDYWDFMYFSFTLGMTAQTSDIAVASTRMRSLTIGHGVVAFLFYMVILASGVNVASGLI